MVFQHIFPDSPATPGGSAASHVLHACRTLYLKQLGQLLQEAGPVSALAVQAFQRSVGGYFDEMAATTRRSSFADARGLTASRISLVHETDLELEIRLGEFSSHLTALIGGDLWQVHLRFITLLERPDLGMADNPVGPKGIALGLNEFCAELGEGHDATLQRIDHLEGYFAHNLGGLYRSLNDLLSEKKVATAQPAIITAPDSSAPATPPDGSNRANPAVLLQNQLAGTTTGGQVATGAAASLFSQAMLEKLLARLDEVDKTPLQAPKRAFASTATHPSLENLIPGLFSAEEKPSHRPTPVDSSQLGIPSGAPEAASIDALAQIFEAIFASPTLPEPIKGALSSLQIPMLKAAMLDAAFFSDRHHPARRLLDTMARAALGLTPDASPQHPLCISIQDIASQVRHQFVKDGQVFERGLADLEALIASRNAAAAQTGETYLPLLYQADRRKQAERRCNKIIEEHLTQGAPTSIARFLREQWQKVMLVNWLANGEQSADWHESVGVIADLLWSIQPKIEVDDRNRLTKMLPPMLLRLNAGMARIGLPAAEQAAFLDACFALQTAAMRRTPTPTSTPSPPPQPESKPLHSALDDDHLHLKIIDQPGDTNRSRLPALRPGTWVTLPLDEGFPFCGRLCQISPESGLLLFANPDREFAVAVHPDLLASLLKAGSARQHNDESLFDAAAEQALRRTLAG